MRALSDAPEPYTITLTPLAGSQLARLSREMQAQARANLLQLADLAAFAAGYSLSVSKMNSLIADNGGLSIRYAIDDAKRSLTVLEVQRA